MPPDVVAARELYTALGKEMPPDPDIHVEFVEVGGIASEQVWAEGVSLERIVILLHGGGWTAGGPPEYRQMAGQLSRGANARVIVPAYRFAPEHRFPAALEDSFAVYRGLLDEGRDPRLIAIGGSSAGSAFSIGTLLMAREADLPLAASLFAVSPALDLAATSPSFNDPNFPDFVSAELLRSVYRRYLGDHDPTDPFASPVYADLTGLPPLHIEVGGAERLIDEARRMVDQAQKCGVRATLEVSEGGIHAFPFIAPETPEARDAIRRIASHIVGCFRVPE